MFQVATMMFSSTRRFGMASFPLSIRAIRLFRSCAVRLSSGMGASFGTAPTAPIVKRNVRERGSAQSPGLPSDLGAPNLRVGTARRESHGGLAGDPPQSARPRRTQALPIAPVGGNPRRPLGPLHDRWFEAGAAHGGGPFSFHRLRPGLGSLGTLGLASRPSRTTPAPARVHAAAFRPP